MIKELKTLEDKKLIINKCKEKILDDIKNNYHLIEYWDNEKTNVTPEEHLNNIIDWCKNNIYSTIWSCQKSSKVPFNGSYGAKHVCERKLKCYVMNNWMKMAMILAGFEVTYTDCIDYETGHIDKMPIRISSIFKNGINFIVRKPKDYNGNIKYNSISDFYDEDDLK